MGDYSCIDKQSFMTAITESQFDIVMADYNLPEFDGLEALEIAKQKCPDLPFIITSGVLGEELAIETLKKGATDYVLKNRLERLIPSIERALKEASEKRHRKKLEKEKDELIEKLQKTINHVKKLSGLLPICAGCKKIRDDKGYWEQVEVYICNHSEATFTHGLCPGCMKKYYPDYYDECAQ